MNILIVNDSKLIENIFCQTLSSAAVCIKRCSTIKDTLIEAKQSHYDFIAVSNKLADGCGIDLIHELRSLKGYFYSPIVLLTSETDSELHINALRAGATDIFFKQNIDELFNLINRLLGFDVRFEASILYVEDSVAQAKPMVELLQSHGFSVDWFASAEEALNAIHQKPYDLILTDIVLKSTMQGTMFVTRIRRMDGDIGDTPIIALTAYDQVDSRVSLFHIGIDDYVNKPVIEEELLSRIIRLVERRRLIISLKQQEEAAQRYSQSKSVFLAHMSHEIRTPLSGIVSTVELLEKTQIDPQQRHLISLLKESSKLTLHILNEILDLSKIEAGKLDIEYLPVNLREIVEGCVQLVLTSAQLKKIDLTLYISPYLPRMIISDRVRLEQIILNLLTNAIKFTGNDPDRTGSIQIRVEAIDFDIQTPGFRICVIDNGIGIRDEAQKKLFEAFTQAENNTYRKFGGTGLGLNIIKSLTELMGGQITVDSKPGQGSQFCVCWPMNIPPANDTPLDLVLSGIQIVVISDHMECGQVLSNYAQVQGAHVSTFSDISEAIHKLNAVEGVKVLILDLDSFDATQINVSPSVGIVELIAHHRIKRLPNSVAIAARPLFYQPYINAIVMATSIESGEIQNSTLIPEAAIKSKHRILLAEDNEINQEIFKVQFELIDVELVIANDGVEALALWRQQNFSLVMTDCEMPNMDGFELTQHIRAEETADKHTIIIAITANALKGEAEHCLAEGMDDYIAKPVSVDDLSRLLSKWLPE